VCTARSTHTRTQRLACTGTAVVQSVLCAVFRPALVTHRTHTRPVGGTRVSIANGANATTTSGARHGQTRRSRTARHLRGAQSRGIVTDRICDRRLCMIFSFQHYTHATPHFLRPGGGRIRGRMYMTSLHVTPCTHTRVQMYRCQIMYHVYSVLYLQLIS